MDTPRKPVEMPKGNDLHVLLVAPSAPPKNSAEAMQAGRFLNALDPSIRITLVTTPITRGWEKSDESLTLRRPNTDVILASLPVHRITQRVLANHRMARFHQPDADFWLPWLAPQISNHMHSVPNVIYSRSYPLSAALLARKLKQRLHVPWMMHLSDPWAGNPYRATHGRMSASDQRMETACIAAADLISLTTEGQANYFRERYSERARDFVVTPNMMPNRKPAKATVAQDRSKDSGPLGNGDKRKIRFLYTGAMYGARQPSTILAALQRIRQQSPCTLGRLEFHFFGHADPLVEQMIDTAPACHRFGKVSFAEASAAQAQADILVTIEPDGSNPLLKHFMPSKVLDYLWHEKRVLALTPSGSETAKLCNAGFGWAIQPSDVEGLADLLIRIIENAQSDQPFITQQRDALTAFSAESVTAAVLDHLKALSHGDRVSVQTDSRFTPGTKP